MMASTSVDQRSARCSSSDRGTASLSFYRRFKKLNGSKPNKSGARDDSSSCERDKENSVPAPNAGQGMKNHQSQHQFASTKSTNLVI